MKTEEKTQKTAGVHLSPRQKAVKELEVRRAMYKQNPISKKEFLQWKVDKFQLDSTIAAAELELIEVQERLIHLKKLYKKRGYHQYPIVRKEVNHV